jgi:hypothetical protein
VGWLSGFSYRKSHVINPASGAGTNYQVRVKAHYGSGTDSGEDVYLNGKCRTDFGDIRFTDDDGVAELAYWMESKVDGDYAIFWVKVNDDLSTTQQTIYIYYGKSDATTTSNGANTFLFFDDFNVDLSKWTVRSGTWILTTDSGYTVLQSPTGDDTQIVAKNFSVLNCRIRARFRVPVASGVYYGVMARTADANNLYLQQWGYSLHEIWKRVAGTWTKLTYVSCVFDTVYHISEFLLYGSSLKAYIDGAYALSVTDATLGTAQTVGLRHGSTTNRFYVDWFFVSKYVDPEPSHGSWGSEETAPVAAVESIVAMCFPMLYIVKFPEEAIVKVDDVDVGVLNQPIVGAAGKVYVGNVECGDFAIESESGTVYVDTTEVGTYSNFVWKRAKMLISKVQGATLSHVAKDFPEVLVKSGKAQDLRSKFTT